MAKSKFKALFDNWVNAGISGAEFTEQDTIFHFILPTLEILGWNVHDVKEVKQGGYPRDFQKSRPAGQRAIDKPDCVISIYGQPYINLEFKRMTEGTIDRYPHRVEDLLRKSEYLGTKYAVLTRFNETIVYDVANGNTLTRFISPRDHLERFDDLWNHLSREKAERCTDWLLKGL